MDLMAADGRIGWNRKLIGFFFFFFFAQEKRKNRT